MISVIKIASYITDRYLEVFGQRIREMKLHKLLYFTQRESLIQLGEPMFPEDIKAWKYGPVVPCVREADRSDRLHETLSESAIAKYKPVLTMSSRNMLLPVFGL